MKTNTSLTRKKFLIVAIPLFVVIISIIISCLVLNTKLKQELTVAIDSTWNSSKSDEQPNYLSKIDELSSYKINSTKKNDDGYIITVTVTAPDLSTKLSQLDHSDLPQKNNKQEIDRFLQKQVEGAEIKDTEAIIYAHKINDEYYITFSDEFADAMSGKLYSYSKKIYSEILQKSKEGDIK